MDSETTEELTQESIVPGMYLLMDNMEIIQVASLYNKGFKYRTISTLVSGKRKFPKKPITVKHFLFSKMNLLRGTEYVRSQLYNELMDINSKYTNLISKIPNIETTVI